MSIDTRPFINHMQRRNQDLSNQLVEAHAAIVERDKAIAKRDEAIAERDVTIARLYRELHDRDNRIMQLQFKLDLFDDDDAVFANAVHRMWSLMGHAQ